MKRLVGLRPSRATVIALVALFAALTGSAVADSVIDGGDVKNNSITGKDIKNFSLLKKDFKKGQLPAGPQGAQGPQGPQGVPGVPGRAGRDGFGELFYSYNEFVLADGETDAVGALCPQGTHPTGGDAGAYDDNGFVRGVIDFDGYYWFDTLPDMWAAYATNNTGGDVTIFVDAICANADTVTEGSVIFKRKAISKRFGGLVPKVK